MEENSSEYTKFKICPCYKYQNERDLFIRYQDDVYIASGLENMNKNAYICLKGKRLIESKKKKENSESDYIDLLSNAVNDDFMISFEQTTRFKLALFFFFLFFL